MWNYEKRLQYPVKITQTNPKIAQVIISQYGGPDGELSASMRYLAQRYTMPHNAVAGLLTDIGVSVAILRIWNETCKNKYKSLVGACSQTSAFMLIFIRRSLRTEMKR